MNSLNSLLLTIAVISMTGCSMTDRHPETVPKPDAYPRITALDSIYISSDSTALRFDANASAQLKVHSPYWFDISYPAYGATVFITITPAKSDSLAAVIDNRRQRMMLNTGGSETAVSAPIRSGDFTSYMYKSVSIRSTPLQFLSSDGERWAVSGTVFFSNVSPDSPVDSLAPMVAQIERDIVHGLSNISER